MTENHTPKDFGDLMWKKYRQACKRYDRAEAILADVLTTVDVPDRLTYRIKHMVAVRKW